MPQDKTTLNRATHQLWKPTKYLKTHNTESSTKQKQKWRGAKQPRKSRYVLEAPWKSIPTNPGTEELPELKTTDAVDKISLVTSAEVPKEIPFLIVKKTPEFDFITGMIPIEKKNYKAKVELKWLL